VALLGRVEDGPLDIAEQLVIVANECEVDVDTLLHGRIGKPLGPFAHEMYPAPEEVACGTHLRRMHIRLGEHTAA